MRWSRQLLERVKSPKSSENDDSEQRRWEYWAQLHSIQECEDVDLPQRYEIARHKIDKQFETIQKEELKIIQSLRTIMVVVGVSSTIFGAVLGFIFTEAITNVSSPRRLALFILSGLIAAILISVAIASSIGIPHRSLSILSPKPFSGPVSRLKQRLPLLEADNQGTPSMLRSGPHDLDQNYPLLEQYQECVNHNEKIIKQQREDLQRLYESVGNVYILALAAIFVFLYGVLFLYD